MQLFQGRIAGPGVYSGQDQPISNIVTSEIFTYPTRKVWDPSNAVVSFCLNCGENARYHVLDTISCSAYAGYLGLIAFTAYTGADSDNSDDCLNSQKIYSTLRIKKNRMWANVQRDGRPTEYRWRPLFNAASMADAHF